MVSILSNGPALAASRQLGVSKLGLQRSITRLTTGRRVNSSLDDASALAAGNTAQANSRSAGAAVIKDQADYFTAMANISGAPNWGISDVEAGNMATAMTNTQLDGIRSETQQGIADAYLGADMGAEMANLTKYQILMQAGTSALNNANQSAQTVMGMFR